jgi:hypothetical protein
MGLLGVNSLPRNLRWAVFPGRQCHCSRGGHIQRLFGNVVAVTWLEGVLCGRGGRGVMLGGRGGCVTFRGWGNPDWDPERGCCRAWTGKPPMLPVTVCCCLMVTGPMNHKCAASHGIASQLFPGFFPIPACQHQVHDVQEQRQ